MLPGSVKHIPESLCESAALTELTLAEGIEIIGDYAFYRTALRQVTLPASVRRVGANAFPADCEVICLRPDTRILPPDAETQD